MQLSSDLKLLTPGIMYQGADRVVLTEAQDSIHFVIEPVNQAVTKLYVMLVDDAVKNKYSIEIRFSVEQAAVEIYGLYQLQDQKTVDIQTMIHHAVPNCSSKQMWRGVLQDAAKATFEGKIVVHPDAQKTNAQLSNKNLLLSRAASVNTRPFLEIYADDVLCAHGATVGCLDEAALFYLRSRGIAEEKARQLLVDAFVADLRDQLPDSMTKQYFKLMVHDELAE